MRPNRGSGSMRRRAYRPRRGSVLADPEVGDASHANVLTGLRGELLAQLLDRLFLVLVGVDVLLLEQRDLASPFRHLTLDDLLHDIVGLALLARLCLEDAALGLALLLGDL